jgi:hypothetical protein
LQIVIPPSDGSKQVAYQPPSLLDVTPAPEAEPVPADTDGMRPPAFRRMRRAAAL